MPPRKPDLSGFNLDLSRPVSRRNFLIGTGSIAALALVGCGSSGSSSVTTKAAPAKVDGDLDLFTWEGYVPEPVIASFEKQYGVKVHQTYYSTEEEMLRKLAAGLPFDAVFVASNYLSRAVEGGLLRTVDKEAMKNYDQVLPAFQTTGYEPHDASKDKRNSEYVGVPYALGGIGITWLADRIGERKLNSSFADLWEQAEGVAKGHTFVFDESQFTLAMALAKIGKDINSTSSSDLDEAAEALLELKPNLAGFGPTAITEEVVNGTGWIQMGYTGDTYYAIQESKEPEEILWEGCKESAIYNNDNCAIPAAAKHPGTATVFMDHLLEPANMKEVVETIGYIVPTKAGVAAYNNLTAKYPFLKAEISLVENFDQWIGTLEGSNLQLWEQTWTKVKAG